MASRLNKSTKIWTLARDLGLSVQTDPTDAIRQFCERRVARIIHDFSGCRTLADLLGMVSNTVGTKFEIVTSENDLDEIQNRYIQRGETAFATLRAELQADTFGITIQRRKRDAWEPRFVSVIDCRGEKAAREYFTKWHELAHLLCLTDQMRLSFRRTHSDRHSKDPEETMMDIIAGHLGFLPALITPHAKGEISFRRIEVLREHLCPEASRESAVTGIARAWPTPVLLVRAELGLKANEARQANQIGFGFARQPHPVLRAVTIIENERARRAGFRIHSNMRAPERSIVHRVFEGHSPDGDADENLDWWESSDGNRLPSIPIRVHARRVWDRVEALIVPANRSYS
jgi:hypothetical protein